MGSLIYQYSDLRLGKLIKRYKRFLADIELESGEVITAHCANTGPMIGVCTSGSWVGVSLSNNPKRKLAYSWEIIEVDGSWVGINTGLTNKLVKLGLQKKIFPELKEYKEIKTEVPYGEGNKSRVDFLLSGNEGKSEKLPLYLEVKNVTLASENIALFPDTVTTRGQKHLRELMALLPEQRAAMLYFINRGDCQSFSPADSYDSVYGELFREAIKVGVEVFPYRFRVSPEGVEYLGLAELIIDN